uniref:Large ribosomal subunit protein mL53 n=1 Tax=Odontella aurita TaxID=265563 RepID=A0A6U6G9Y6_9STRA|mmetsp:Transcript_40367/g.121633  ORF Transcript_40367/g.121633 Transcript_40367/m.121633 type:complete len:115 (+) Transcript_40367:337-681(+)
MRFTRDITTHLFKYVRTVDIKFNPFDGRTGSAKELLRQVLANRYRKANPKLEIKKNVVFTAEPPLIKFKFVDETEKIFEGEEYNVNEMLQEVYMHANMMDFNFEVEERNIEDDL